MPLEEYTKLLARNLSETLNARLKKRRGVKVFAPTKRK